jgi:hypothetical protein
MFRACPPGENGIRFVLKFAAHNVLPDKFAATFISGTDHIHPNKLA